MSMSDDMRNRRRPMGPANRSPSNDQLSWERDEVLDGHRVRDDRRAPAPRSDVRNFDKYFEQERRGARPPERDGSRYDVTPAPLSTRSPIERVEEYHPSQDSRPRDYPRNGADGVQRSGDQVAPQRQAPVFSAFRPGATVAQPQREPERPATEGNHWDGHRMHHSQPANPPLRSDARAAPRSYERNPAEERFAPRDDHAPGNQPATTPQDDWEHRHQPAADWPVEEPAQRHAGYAYTEARYGEGDGEPGGYGTRGAYDQAAPRHDGYDPSADDALHFDDDIFPEQQRDAAATPDAYWGGASGDTTAHAFHAPQPLVPQHDTGDADYFSDEADDIIDGYGTPKPRSRKMLLMAVLVGTALAGGGAAYVYNMSGGPGTDTADVPVVPADNAPLRDAPAEAGGREFANKSKLIYDRLSDRAPGGAESATAATEAAASAAPAPDALDSRIESALRTAQGGAASSGNAVASDAAPASAADRPRPVEALVLRPDGTTEAAPAPRALAAASSSRLTAPVATAPTTTAAVRPIAPAPRAAPPTPAAVAPAAPVSSGGAGYYVQVGSAKDPNAANTEMGVMQTKYGAVLEGAGPDVKRVDLGEKGVWYRLRLGPLPDKTAAVALCDKLKASGLPGCLIQSQ